MLCLVMICQISSKGAHLQALAFEQMPCKSLTHLAKQRIHMLEGGPGPA